jgi:hypothetical protein
MRVEPNPGNQHPPAHAGRFPQLDPAIYDQASYARVRVVVVIIVTVVLCGGMVMLGSLVREMDVRTLLFIIVVGVFGAAAVLARWLVVIANRCLLCGGRLRYRCQQVGIDDIIAIDRSASGSSPDRHSEGFDRARAERVYRGPGTRMIAYECVHCRRMAVVEYDNPTQRGQVRIG